jgi:hypothetical protein
MKDNDRKTGLGTLFGARARTLFFPDGKAADGSRLDGAFIASHCGRMGAALKSERLLKPVQAEMK